MKKIGIYEMFASIQGEGLLQGIPSVLLRLVGCNLSCSWCDTQDFLQGGRGTYYSLEEIMDALAVYDCRNIVITGRTFYPPGATSADPGTASARIPHHHRN